MADGGTRPIRLRPHHFLCMLTYGGRGYTEEFVANFDRIIERLNTGEATVEIVAGPDDVCDPMMQCQDHPDFHCLRESVVERDRRALEDLGQLLAPEGLRIAVGDRLRVTEPLVRALRVAFAANAIRSACPSCEWFDRCSGRAMGGFAGARLMPPPDPSRP